MIKVKRKICVVTGTRAEYGLLFWSMKKLAEREDADLQIIVTGMHLSPEFGNTHKAIEQDGFVIDRKIECLLSSDTSVGISKSVGLGVISFGEAFADLNPDLILVLGDRFEILAAVTAAMLSRIPVAHCHGGEATEGLIDEAIRHSITKMSQLHFASTAEYRNRIIQLGEQPNKVFNVGALGIENINRIKLMSKEDFEASINCKLKQKNYMVTFHPVTLDKASAETQFKELIDALDEQEDSLTIFTKPNADNDGRIIITMIDEYVAANRDKAIAFTSLGQLRYLSAMQYLDAVIGNSSSGLIEVPSFKIPTINIGDRQKGRIAGSTVINCEASKSSVSAAINQALSNEFITSLKTTKNPYGEKNSSDLIVNEILDVDLNGILKKKFYNL